MRISDWSSDVCSSDLRQELLSRILGVNGHLTVFADGPPMKNFDDLAARLESVDGVVSVTPQVQGQVMITTPGAATGGLARGLRPEDVAARPILADNILVGSLAAHAADHRTPPRQPPP